MDKYIKKIIEERPAADSYKYMLLDRLKTDCNYYIYNGHRSKNCLWSQNEKEHIENMKALLKSFPENQKPEWLSMKQIEEYEKEMLG